MRSRLIILPIRPIYELIRKGMVRIVGEEETRSLENDMDTFSQEVYDDTVGELIRDNGKTPF